MKFLCIPCDVKMETQIEGIMPEEKQNLVMQFKCKKCGHSIAMLTNKFETEFVSKLGVEMGGPTDVSKSPMAAVSSSLAQAKEELKSTNPEDDLIWTEEAEQPLKKVPQPSMQNLWMKFGKKSVCNRNKYFKNHLC